MKKYLKIFILLLFNNLIFAQAAIKIAFGESINLGNIPQNISFGINSKSDKFLVVGNNINEFIFKKPGLYQTKVLETSLTIDVDEHGKIPENFVVNVDDSKIIFNQKSIKFSKPIRKNQETSGIILSIDVEIINFENKMVKMSTEIVKVSGIGSEIICSLNKKHQKLSSGVHTIQYYLSGKVSENAYLMFDFVNPNGTIQSISLLESIKD
ncbi:MAG: hypothetical protein H7174_05080 [Flavobacterium sp.]|nr:hypothetical protein [Flavobacterium sp.]